MKEIYVNKAYPCFECNYEEGGEQITKISGIKYLGDMVGAMNLLKERGAKLFRFDYEAKTVEGK